MSAKILSLTSSPLATRNVAYSDESVDAQLIRAKRTIKHQNEQIEKFKQALRAISDFPYDEKEQDEDGNWKPLSNDDAQDYLYRAVTLAFTTLYHAQPKPDLSQIMHEMMTAIGTAQVLQQEIEQ